MDDFHRAAKVQGFAGTAESYGAVTLPCIPVPCLLLSLTPASCEIKMDMGEKMQACAKRERGGVRVNVLYR